MDALRDLDDPLTMANLFARLPAESAHDIPARVVATARRLALEFEAYVVRAHALRKVFVSVKGFYYQADIQGQAVTWLVPHNLAQVISTAPHVQQGSVTLHCPAHMCSVEVLLISCHCPQIRSACVAYPPGYRSDV